MIGVCSRQILVESPSEWTGGRQSKSAVLAPWAGQSGAASDLGACSKPNLLGSSTRLVLSLREAAGELKFREVIASTKGELAKGKGAISVLPTLSGHEARLLVGYGPELWMYEVKRP